MNKRQLLILINNALLRFKGRIAPDSTNKKERAFQRIFARKDWGPYESVSGHGSTLRETENIRTNLPRIIEKHGIDRLIDAPCGDLFWIKEIFEHLESYVGLDIVPEIITQNRARFPEDKYDFRKHDITREPLVNADAILVRDLFIHFPEQMIRDAIKNIIRSDIRLFICSNYPAHREYKEISLGSYRNVNLLREPFSLPEPAEIIEENSPDKNLSIWRVADLKLALNRARNWK